MLMVMMMMMMMMLMMMLMMMMVVVTMMYSDILSLKQGQLGLFTCSVKQNNNTIIIKEQLSKLDNNTLIIKQNNEYRNNKLDNLVIRGRERVD